jgi:hypothetical protein
MEGHPTGLLVRTGCILTYEGQNDIILNYILLMAIVVCSVRFSAHIAERVGA